MTLPLFVSDWRSEVIFSAGGPQPRVLHEDEKVKVVVVGLEVGSQIPPHPGTGGIYHFLEGEGEMIVDGATFDVVAGSTVIVPAGATRGMTPRTRLAFIAVRVG